MNEMNKYVTEMDSQFMSKLQERQLQTFNVKNSAIKVVEKFEHNLEPNEPKLLHFELWSKGFTYLFSIVATLNQNGQIIVNFKSCIDKELTRFLRSLQSIGC